MVSRDRVIVVSAILAVVALSWVYLLTGAGVDMMAPATWTVGYAILMFLMWWIMMMAMMLPSATPMILLFATVNRSQREDGHAYVSTSVFVLGYLVAWAGFSVLAVGLQWSLERSGNLSPMLVADNAALGGTLLLLAGIYQFLPLKHACLRHCRSPQSFISTHWRPGTQGAFRMGLVHGAFCVGCCWFLMGLLFFGGVMNLYWIAGIALWVLLEKLAPKGHWISYLAGVMLLAWGTSVLWSAL